MEKGYDAVDTPLLGSAPAKRPHASRINVGALLTTVTVLIVFFGLRRLPPGLLDTHLSYLDAYQGDDKAQDKLFDFFTIDAKDTLRFLPCYEDFQCAKLRLPYDYFNGTYPNETVSIAIIKLPARVPVEDPRYAGPVLVNPGGPGGSGVALALLDAKPMQIIVDPASAPEGEGKYYDIIGFDPRGVGYSEPAARCMPDGPSSWSWHLRKETEGMLGSSDAALGRLWSMTHAYGTSCKQASDAQEGPDIKKYMSTASVARDMIEIAEKHADWVAEETAGLSVPKEISESKSVKLQYWGFSYGTYLGATFAAMFPDRVSRLVLDGVVNVHDYRNALGQGSLHDTEKGMSSFYTFCREAGPKICPLALSTSSAEDIEQRVKDIIQSLYHDPLMLTSDKGPDIFTYTDLKNLIFSALYTPSAAFKLVADVLAGVENRGGSIFDSFVSGFARTHIYQCPIDNSSLPYAAWDRDVPQDAIICGDGVDQTSTDLQAFEEYWHLVRANSPSAGSQWAMLKMQCAAWKIKPVFRFSDEDNFYGNTSFPILWVANTADPVTPLKSARIMQERYPGSGLLVQDSAGHCSSALPVVCTIKRIRAYFQNGTLPDPNTVCVPPVSPWSLNSTDPDSPFYDPSLGQPVYLAEEEFEEEISAAKRLQSWAAGHDFFGRSQAGTRVKKMMMSAMMNDWVTVDVLEDVVL